MAPYSNRQLFSVGHNETSNKKVWYFWNKIERRTSSYWKDNMFLCQLHDLVISDNIKQQHMTVWGIWSCPDYRYQITAFQDWMLRRRTWRWRQGYPYSVKLSEGHSFGCAWFVVIQTKLENYQWTWMPPPPKITKWDITNGRYIRMQGGLLALPSAHDLLVSRTPVSI
jgi:hypothetical protein